MYSHYLLIFIPGFVLLVPKWLLPLLCSCGLGEGRGGDEQDDRHLSQGVQGSLHQGRKPVRSGSYQKLACPAWVYKNCRDWSSAEILFCNSKFWKTRSLCRNYSCSGSQVSAFLKKKHLKCKFKVGISWYRRGKSFRMSTEVPEITKLSSAESE